jgi:hypothetical protein
MAPGHFTYGSHASMFVGFTPSLPGAAEPFLDSKFAKLFRLGAINRGRPDDRAFILEGRSIIEGFNRLGYQTIGSGAVRWFDPQTPTGGQLIQDFSEFYYSDVSWNLSGQLDWIQNKIDEAGERPVFVFLNIGETHTPYFFGGAPWDANDNPCLPFQCIDRAAECRTRQIACVEFIDRMLPPLLSRFKNATTLVCADHGDCWGEDGLWEHGVSHEMTLAVPLLLRVRGVPVARRQG